MSRKLVTIELLVFFKLSIGKYDGNAIIHFACVRLWQTRSRHTRCVCDRSIDNQNTIQPNTELLVVNYSFNRPTSASLAGGCSSMLLFLASRSKRQMVTCRVLAAMTCFVLRASWRKLTYSPDRGGGGGEGERPPKVNDKLHGFITNIEPDFYLCWVYVIGAYSVCTYNRQKLLTVYFKWFQEHRWTTGQRTIYQQRFCAIMRQRYPFCHLLINFKVQRIVHAVFR